MIVGLLLPGSSFAHRAAPEAKVVAAILFAVGAAATPRDLVWALATDALVLVGLLSAIGYRPAQVLSRASIVAPFLVYAATIPFLAGGPTTSIGPIEVSEPGVWAAWNTAAKTTLGFGCALVLAGSTKPEQLVVALQRLRLPSSLVTMVSFLFRYGDLLADDLSRSRRAMTARGHDPRWLWQARPLATATGALFVRTYERGERVHGAMLARGFDGYLPDTGRRADAQTWIAALALGSVPWMAWAVAAVS